jgi:fructose-bisphosphate aldolase class II
MGELLQDGLQRGYAVGAFDVCNLEMAESVLAAALENNSPVIVAIAEAFFPLNRFETLVNCLKEQATPLRIPVALILDHGRSYESSIRALRAGVTSVMFDGSALPYEQNVAITREVVKAAHAVGVTAEAEIGHVGQGAEYERTQDQLTSPDEALRFVEDTGVDALAVAVGTAHGKYKGEPKIHYDLLATIHDTVKLPLVLHGGSSTGDERLQKSIRYGVAKINIYTDMADEAKRRIKRTLDERYDKVRINDLILETRAAFKEVSAHYMQLFGSAGKA